MDKLPFLRLDYTTPILRDWLLHEQDQGCSPISSGLCVQMLKAPPPRPAPVTPGATKIAAPKPVAPAPAEPAPPKKDSAVAFLEWMIERGEKKQQQPQEQLKKQAKPPQTLDLYELPAALKAAGFPVAAQLCQRWLDGRAYTAYGPDGTEGRYDSDMLDMGTVSLGWLRAYPKIEKRYQALLGKLANTNAINELRNNTIAKYLANYKGMSHELNTREHCKGDWQEVHAQFQFQLESVDMLDTLTDSLGMTDVTAAMANFAFYAAVAKANIKTAVYNRYNTPSGTQSCRKSTVEVTHVWVYAKDSYSFQDPGASSQYLGHWNKKGVIVLPMAVAASVGMSATAAAIKPYSKDAAKLINALRVEFWNEDVSLYAVDVGRSLAEKDVYVPIYNRHLRQWRDQHQRGGDLLIMTEPKLIKLQQPIVIDMPEVCK